MRFRFTIFILLLLTSCGRDSAELPGKVVLFGIDAADRVVIERMAGRGELPHFARLMRDGVIATMLVEEPVFSPVVWTSELTGFRPDAHGITSFTRMADGKRVPVTSNLRARKSVWEIAGDEGVEVGVVGHWVTWPAEPVNGFLVSNYAFPPSPEYEKEWTPTTDWDSIGFRTYPADILDDFRSYAKNSPLVRTDEVPRASLLDTALKHYFEKDMANLNGGVRLFDEYDPRFLTIYMESIDFFQHRLWLLHEYYEFRKYDKDMAPLEVPEREPPASAWTEMGALVGDSYRLADRWLGILLERLDLSRDAIVIVSDHGFESFPPGTERHIGDDRRQVMPFWHSDRALLIAAGPPFRAGGAPDDPIRPEDVTPLVLHILGLAVGEDMDGEVPLRLLDPRFAEAFPVRTVTTYETGDEEREEVPIASPADDAMRAMLKSLGYLD
ncbi:MAG: hypothetical protein HKN20_07270 [Gemmatimonadetes bacterium]|nr:hypothetical protein [Gemmatimonadota bacterium]